MREVMLLHMSSKNRFRRDVGFWCFNPTTKGAWESVSYFNTLCPNSKMQLQLPKACADGKSNVELQKAELQKAKLQNAKLQDKCVTPCEVRNASQIR